MSAAANDYQPRIIEIYIIGDSVAATPSLSPTPEGRGKPSPSPSGGRVGKGDKLSPIM